jgi:tRNA (guanine6-N2)-methyltransferase
VADHRRLKRAKLKPDASSRRALPARQQAEGLPPRARICVIETVHGLEALAAAELSRLGAGRVRMLSAGKQTPGEITCEIKGKLAPLLGLRAAQSVYLLENYPVPRPKALLGDQYFRRLVEQAMTAIGLWPAGTFQTLYLSAAGSESSVMNRLKQELAGQCGLQVASHEGDLLLRLHPARSGDGWEALVRLAPRPLATRAWRVCNFEGALNATVAYAMCQLVGIGGNDLVANLACGSGSLLLECLGGTRPKAAYGLDRDAQALTCTQANLAAGGFSRHVHLVQADLRDIPFPVQTFSVLLADLPFGNLVGSHAENLELYPAVLAEAARIAQPGARFALITHEVRLAEALIEAAQTWELVRVMRVAFGGLNPRIYLLQRTRAPIAAQQRRGRSLR